MLLVIVAIPWCAWHAGVAGATPAAEGGLASRLGPHQRPRGQAQHACIAHTCEEGAPEKGATMEVGNWAVGGAACSRRISSG